MAKQFEDIIDSCLQALYGDKYDFAFLLFFADHSSGHDKKGSDGPKCQVKWE